MNKKQQLKVNAKQAVSILLDTLPELDINFVIVEDNMNWNEHEIAVEEILEKLLREINNTR